MIRYGLVCASGHGFDGWFRSSDDFDAQAAGALLSCPACGSADVRKALMAPAVSTRGSGKSRPTDAVAAPEPVENVALVDDGQAKLRQMMREFRTELTKNSENVGDRFPEIARKMHAEEVAHRTIHGRATPDEAKALVDEGISVQPLPTFPDDMN